MSKRPKGAFIAVVVLLAALAFAAPFARATIPASIAAAKPSGDGASAKLPAPPTIKYGPSVAPLLSVVVSHKLFCFSVWLDKPSLSYQWLRDGVAIPGATGLYFVYAPTDTEHKLACRATATNKGGKTTLTSAPYTPPPPSGLPAALPDHFKCYRVARERNLVTQRFVSLHDQFLSAERVQIQRAQELCAPVQKQLSTQRETLPITFEPRLVFTYAHLVCYRVILPGFAPRTVLISNQFGNQQALVTNTETLCVPSRKALRLLPKKRPDAADVLDHYLCYRVVPSSPLIGGRAFVLVKLTDQFGISKAGVGQLVQLCNPVSKNREPIKNPQSHLACYRIFDAFKQRFIFGNRVGVIAPFEVNTFNQFGYDHLSAFPAVSLCVPSLKTEIRQPPPPPPPPPPPQPSPPPPEKCQPGYTGTPPTCTRVEGTGLFKSTGSPEVKYQLQFNQQTTAYEIVYPGGNIFGIPGGCHSETVKSPNDAIVCTANTPANTPISGQFGALPMAGIGTKFETYGFQAAAKFGPFGPFEAS